MSYFTVSFNAVAPIFCMLSLGYFLKRKGFADGCALDVMNKLCFQFFLPALLFSNIYETDLKKCLDLRLMGFTAVIVLIIYCALMLVLPLAVKDRKRTGVMIQAIFRSNFVILGIPMTSAVFGPEATGVAAMLVGVVVPLYNLLSVITLQMFCSGKISLRSTLKGIVKNPLIISAAAAVILLVFSVRLPVFLADTLSDVGKIASPLSIVVLGGFFEFQRVTGNRRAIAAGVLGKLVIVPGIVMASGIFMGFRGIELMVLLTCTGTPTAISSFVMAEQMGGDGELAGQLVVFTSLLSCGTMFLWIFMLQHMGVM